MSATDADGSKGIGEPTAEELARHPHTAALRARRRSTGWWKGAGLASALIALVAVVLLAILLLVPLTVASTLEDQADVVPTGS